MAYPPPSSAMATAAVLKSANGSGRLTHSASVGQWQWTTDTQCVHRPGRQFPFVTLFLKQNDYKIDSKYNVRHLFESEFIKVMLPCKFSAQELLRTNKMLDKNLKLKKLIDFYTKSGVTAPSCGHSCT
ncbi:hypothetical protein QTP88_022980 [Uroleucon formosanum]